jgi:hypothetical protein
LRRKNFRKKNAEKNSEEKIQKKNFISRPTDLEEEIRTKKVRPTETDDQT